MITLFILPTTAFIIGWVLARLDAELRIRGLERENSDLRLIIAQRVRRVRYDVVADAEAIARQEAAR